MSFEKKICAIDIGTYKIRGIIGQIESEKPEGNNWKISGFAEVSSFGVRRGEIVDVVEVSKCLKQLIKKLEIKSGFKVNQAWINIGGPHVYCKEGKGAVAVSRADGKISNEDVDRSIEAATIVFSPRNRQNVCTLPRYYRIDDQDIARNPAGMQGKKLEANVLIIEAFTPQFKNLQQCLQDSGIDILGLVYTPLAVSEAILSRRQKELGVMALDFGGGVTNLTIFEEQDILDISTLPVGSNHLTNDLAVGLRVPVDVAEKIKIGVGRVDLNNIDRRKTIDLSRFGGDGSVSQYEIGKIVQARIEEILELVNKELKRIGRQNLLPGGVVICGGGAQLKGLSDLVKDYLGLPVQIGIPEQCNNSSFEEVQSPEWATVCGLIDWVLNNQKRIPQRSRVSGIAKRITHFFKRIAP